MEMISKEKAQEIGQAYFAKRGIKASESGVKDLKDVRFCGYGRGADTKDAWIMFYPNPRFPGMGLHSSYAILISKETGDVVFDGDACDEG